MDASLGVDAQRTGIMEAVFFYFVQRSASEKREARSEKREARSEFGVIAFVLKSVQGP